MKLRNDKKALRNYLDQHGDYFHRLKGGMHLVVGELIQLKTLLNKKLTKEEEEEGVNVCKALDDIYQDGVEKGARSKLQELVRKIAGKGYSSSEIADMLEEKEEVISDIIATLA